MNKILMILLFPLLFILPSCDSGGDSGSGGSICSTCDSDIMGQWEVTTETVVYSSSCGLSNVTFSYNNESFYTLNSDGTFDWSASSSGDPMCSGIYDLDEDECEVEVHVDGSCPELNDFVIILENSDGGPFDVCTSGENLTLQGTFSLAPLGYPENCYVTATYIFVEN